MPHPSVPSIRSLCEYPVELSHPLREIAVRGLHHQMVVVRHLAIGVTDPVEPLDHLRQGAKKHFAVFVVFIDRLLPITPGSDVVQGTGEFNTQRSGYTREFSLVGSMLQFEP